MIKKLSKHDNFFAKCIENHDIVKSLFTQYFPPSVQSYIDWETADLKQLNTKFVDDAGHQYVLCDALYQVSNKDNDTLLLFHLEHQSSPDKTMAFRTIYYAMGAINQYLNHHPKKPFPPVLSLIYFQNRKPYTHSLELSDLLDENVPDAIKNLFLKPILINSAENTDEELRTHGEASNFEMILKHRVEKSTIENEEILSEASDKMPRHLRSIALQYSMKGSSLGKELTRKIYSKHFDSEELMTYEKQMQKEGMHKAAEEIARNLLADGLEIARVAKNTGLDLETVKKIKATIH